MENYEQQLIRQYKKHGQKSLKHYLQQGKILIQAHQHLGLTGKAWDKWVSDNLNISPGYASMQKSIAGNPTIVQHVKHGDSPNDVLSLYHLSRIDPDVLAANWGQVRPVMSRDEIQLLSRTLKPRETEAGKRNKRKNRQDTWDADPHNHYLAAKERLNVARDSWETMKAEYEGKLTEHDKTTLLAEIADLVCDMQEWLQHMRGNAEAA